METNRTWLQRFGNKLSQWIAWRLPKNIVYFALIRAWANATTGQWSHEEAPAVSMDAVITRWHAAKTWAGEQKE